MFYSASDEATAGTPPARKPFSQLAVFAQKLRSSVLPPGHEVRAASNIVATSLSLMEPGKGRVTGKFNFGVGMEG